MKSKFPLIIGAVFLVAAASLAASNGIEHYLLMQPIQDAFKTNNFALLKNISEKKISVNFEPPFEFHGYISMDKFIDDFSRQFSPFETKIEWGSKQLEEQFAVQSLILVLKDKRSDKTIYYKFIFFLTKKAQKWKIYYLRGLKI